MYRAISTYRYRWFWNRIYRYLVVTGAVLFCFVALLGAGVLFSRLGGQVLWVRLDPRALLQEAMPVLNWTGSREDTAAGRREHFFIRTLLIPLGLPGEDPRALLRSQLPLLAAVKTEEKGSMPPAVATGPDEPAGLPEVSGDYLIAVYHTHTGETYTLTDGTARLEGKEGGVVTVGEAIRQELESKYHISTLHIRKIYDLRYNSSYVESEKTVREILSQHSQIKVLLDIYRDAGKPRHDCLVKVNGKDVAPILFVVGSDARAPFPTWRQNYQFANQLAAALDKKYPGLCKGVRVKEGRYNQFLHPRALLVEIGSANNSTEEAVASARLFADVLGEEVQRMVTEQKQDSTGKAEGSSATPPAHPVS